MDKIKEAYEIAVTDLRSCYAEHGIIAGLHQFNDYWARDAFFASFGALELGDFQAVRNQLNNFLHYVSESSCLLPKKILHTHNIKLMSLIRKTAAGNLFTYRSRDQNSLFVICASNYVKKSKDLKFARTHYEKIKNIMMYDFKCDKDLNLLLEQGFYEGWDDSLRKKGETLYINVCHYAALRGLADIAGIIKKKEDQEEYNFFAEKVKCKLNTMFWNGEHYLDSVGKGGNVFSSGGNMLAVIWGVADRKQAISINNYIKKHRLENFTLETNYPRYKWWQVSPVLRFFGLKDYHNGMRWLWLGCADVVAKLNLGLKKEAGVMLKKIAEKICEYRSVYEVYEKDGKPVRRLLYKSEVPFAWSSGFFVYAYNRYRQCQLKCVFNQRPSFSPSKMRGKRRPQHTRVDLTANTAL